jgi:galactokinase
LTDAPRPEAGATGDGPTWYPRPGDAEVAQRLGVAFAAAYGRTADGVWFAPGRVNVIGEHLDYNGGRCLPFAIGHRTYVALAARADGRLRVGSMQAATGPGFEGSLAEVAPGTVSGWAGYAVGVPWALRGAGYAVPGFDALVDGHVPSGSGLSSSAALGCAVGVALDAVAGLGLGVDDRGRAALAAAVMRSENEIAQAPTGGLDQAASLRCTAGHALLVDCRDFSTEQVPFDMADAGLELLVIDTRAHHAHAHGGYGSRRAQCEQAAGLLGVRYLVDVPAGSLESAVAGLADSVDDRELGAALGRRLRHVVTESQRVDQTVASVRSGRVADVGAVLAASHASLRDDFEVSCEELDLACSTADANGALGSRMIGGGFGGSAIALVRGQDTGAVAGAVHVAFAVAGFAEPRFLRAHPSGAAGQVGGWLAG